MHNDYSIEILDLEGVKIEKVIRSDKYIKLYAETDPFPQKCPLCGSEVKRIHDYRYQSVKDLPIHMKHTVIILKKRRYRCACGKRFYEKYDFLPRYLHRTSRLTVAAAYMFKDAVSVKYVAESVGLSQTTVNRITDRISRERKRFGDTIGIDEFKGNTGGEKYQCIITDPKKRIIVDILPDRKESHLSAYFRSMERNERNKVKYFVCDMWKPYADMGRTYFPNAKICVDRYHFVRQVTYALEKVRKRAQRTMRPELRRYYKKSRKLMLSGYEKLSEENRKACDLMLLYHDDLRRAHWLKEKFFGICEEKRYSVVRKDFKDWIRLAESSGIPEFKACVGAFRNWSKEILNSFKYGVSNGPTEGFNNKIKVLKRVSYGVRNFERFRMRILSCTA